MENNFKRFLSLVVAVVMVLGMMPMSVFAAESNEASQSNLVAWYDFNSVEGTTVKDETGNGNDATLINNAEVAEDARGAGYVMSLAGGRASSAPGLSLPVQMFQNIEDVTIIMDVKLDSTSTWMCLLNAGVSGQQHKYMTFVNEGYEDGSIGISNATSHNGNGSAEKRIYADYNTKLTPGAWGRVALRHVASTGEAQIYLNNVKVAEGTLDVTLQELAVETGCEVRIGSNNIWDDPGLDGLVDNIRIYNKALSEEEMQSIPWNAIDTEAELVAAVAKGGEIELGGDITLGQELTISTDTTITGKYTITRADNYTGTLFVVDKGVELTLKNVVVDGGNEWTFHEKEYKAQVNSGERVSNGAVRYTTYEEGAPVATKTVVAVSGSVNLDGATFRNHVGSSVFSVADGAELIMTNALITHNTKNGSSVVASVSAGGTWIINEGTRITDNHNHGGNGSLSYMCGTTIMNGGEISGNSGVDNNGSVFMIYGSTSSFTLNNGRIADNWALYGSNNGWNCAFYVYGNGAAFIMNGGIIENNVSTKVPGVANNGSNGTIQINGGEIRNNTSTTGIGGMDLYSYCPVEIGEDVTVTGSARFFGKAVVDGVIMGSLYLSGSSKISGKGTVTQKVVVFSSTNATIESGNYLGELDIRQGGVLTITGGRFADLNAIKYLAPGLGLAKNADGTYTVTDQVAEVNGVVYNSVAAAEEAAGEGDTIKLLAIAPVKESVVVDQQTILDLNNNEIYATTDDVYPVIRAVADVTVTGEGGVDAMRFGSGYAFIVGSDEAEGQLTIESGKHYGDTTVASVTKGTLNIKGGYYEALPYGEYGYRYTLNCIDASYIDGSAKINVTGGTFYGFDPDNNLAEGEGTDFVPESHASTKSENADEAGVYTWTVVFDAVAYNVQDAKFFNDLSDALDAADSGETVQLLKTWEEKLVLVRAGVTFDLNGNVVKTENVLSFGVVMDGKEQVGGIEIAKDTTAAFTKLQPENGGYLPIYDTTAGQYKFFAYEVESNKVEGGDGNATFWMRLVFDNAAAYDVLANTGDSCVDFYATMDWTGIDGFGVRYLMSDENVKSYAAAAYEQLQGGNANSKAMYLKVTGVGKLGEGAFVSATPGVATVAEVAASADALVYNVG